MRKPKAEVSENWAGEEETSQSDSSAGQSTLEISGPTIPSPGPSGTCHMNQLLSSMCSTQHRTFLETGVCVCVLQEGGRTTAVWAGQDRRSVSAHGG